MFQGDDVNARKGSIAMKYCKRCVQPESNPGLTLNEEGICNVCEYYFKEKTNVNWESRLRELKEITSWAKATSKGTYDCVIGVSGGKDSTRQAIYARDELGLNCLLVNNPPDLITDVGRHNINSLYNHGFDLIKYYANPVVYKKLVKRALLKYGNPQKPSEYTIAAAPIRVAINFNIPLVIHGENSALEMGEPDEFTTGDDFGGSALGFANSNTVQGGHAEDLVGDRIELEDLLAYQYPSEEEIKRTGVRAVYLGYYLKDFNTFENARFSIRKGLKVKTESLYDLGRYHRYSALDGDINIINGMIKHIKFGYGSATDKASLDIRAGKITREEGIALVKEFDGRCADRFVREYCEFLEIPVDEFWRIIESFRGDMWTKAARGEWVLKNPIWEQEPPPKDIEVRKIIQSLNEELGIDQDIE